MLNSGIYPIVVESICKESGMKGSKMSSQEQARGTWGQESHLAYPLVAVCPRANHLGSPFTQPGNWGGWIRWSPLPTKLSGENIFIFIGFPLKAWESLQSSTAPQRVQLATLGWESLGENINKNQLQCSENKLHCPTNKVIIWTRHWLNNKPLQIFLVGSYTVTSSLTPPTISSHPSNQTHSIPWFPVLCQLNHFEGYLWLNFSITLYIKRALSSCPSLPCLLLDFIWCPVWRLW